MWWAVPEPTVVITEALNVISDCVMDALLAPLLPMKMKTFPVLESTTGASATTWETAGTMVVDPRHGGEPDAQVPAVLNDSRM
jgi:hypothetical protein